MKNKFTIVIIILLFCSIFTFAQNNEFNLIKLDSTWGKEVIRFPGREINYVGVGEIRFPPKGWRQPEHTFFWSYTYAWSINLSRKIPAIELASDLEKYFNSLNNIALEDVNNSNLAKATITKTKIKKSITFYEGKVATFDRFATNKRFVLNVKIESRFCKKTQKTVILFKFSPKGFTNEVWETLNGIVLLDTICKN